MTEGLVCVADAPAFIPDRIVHAIHRNLWRVNSTILGAPEQLEEAAPSSSDNVIASENGNLFDPTLSGKERANVLLEILQVSSLASD